MPKVLIQRGNVRPIWFKLDRIRLKFGNYPDPWDNKNDQYKSYFLLIKIKVLMTVSVQHIIYE